MKQRTLAAAAAALVVAACGGGNDAAPPQAAAVQPIPLAQAQQPLAQQSSDAAITGALRVYQALYGRAPTAAEFATLATSNTLTLATTLAASLSGQSDSAFASTVLTNMGVTSARVNTVALTVLQAALAQFFAAYGPGARGVIVNNLVTLLGNLESDGTWGTAARAFNTSVTSARTAIEGSIVTVPLQAAYQAWVSQQKTSSYTLSGTTVLNGQTYTTTGTGTLSESTVTATFEGQPTAKRKTLTYNQNVSTNGTAQSQTDVTQVYTTSGYVPLGFVESGGGYCVSGTAAALPASARAGDTGTWYTQTCYTGSTKQVENFTTTYRYAIEASSASALLMRVTWRVSSSGATTDNTDLFSVSTAGTMSWLSRTSSGSATAPVAFTTNVALTFAP